jgi:hypothetical protein
MSKHDLQMGLDFLRQEYFADPEFIRSVSESSEEQWLAEAGERRNDSNCTKTILSLFDFTGQWAKPYWDAGYNVINLDLKHGIDINDFCCEYLFEELGIEGVWGVLAACPCTEFACSGARWFAQKDLSGRTQKAIHLVRQALRTVELYDPEFWVIENPVGRMAKLIPELNSKPFYFNPCDYAEGFEGEAYTKKTGLWGKFVPPTVANIGEDRSVFPHLGSKMHTSLGGSSERTKMLRSVTPNGFAKAFFDCNK